MKSTKHRAVSFLAVIAGTFVLAAGAAGAAEQGWGRNATGSSQARSQSSGHQMSDFVFPEIRVELRIGGSNEGRSRRLQY